MYCSNCGEKVNDTMNHCPNCGSSLPKQVDNKDFTYVTGSVRQKVMTGKKRSKEYMECLYGITQGVDALYLTDAIEQEFADIGQEEWPESVLILEGEEVYLASFKGAKVKKYSSIDQLPDKLKELADTLEEKKCICAEIDPECIKFINAGGEVVLTQYQKRKSVPEKTKAHLGSLHMYDEPMPYKPGTPRKYEKFIIKIGIAVVIGAALICVYLLKWIPTVQNDGQQKKASVSAQQNQQKAENNTSASGEKKEENKAEVKEEEEPSGENHDYIFSDSSKRYLSENELYSLTKEQLSIARNEIFARLGRKFNTEELNQYFRSKEWYVPLYEADDFDAKGDSVLNEYEKANVTLISDYEKKKGYR